MSTALFISRELPQSRANDRRCTLEGWGLFKDLLLCSDEASALDLLEQSPPDAVFYAWPENDTDSLFTFLRTMQEHDAWSELPVLVMTDKNQLLASLTALEHGAADCLTWQLSTAECQARVKTHLNLRERINKLRRANKRLARVALTDMLTGLYNRTYFDMALENEVARSKRTGQPMSLLLVDLDHFKRINDTFGHQVGDRVLQLVAESFKLTCRRPDIVCRYGGEEFVLILPETDARAAIVLADRIRGNLRGVTCIAAERQVKVSATIGLSCPDLQDLDAQSLLEQADTALYAGKRKGRNRTEIYSRPRPKGLAAMFPGPGIMQTGIGYS